MRILTLGDPVLREKCVPVEAVDRELELLARDMGDTLREAPGRVGLAAPQVGVLKRLFIYDLGWGARCLINPEIIETEGEYPREEGCLSIPGIYVTVQRYDLVKVRGTTLSGYHIVLEIGGFGAQVIQHECDHLDGVLIIDRCDPEERGRALTGYEEFRARDRPANGGEGGE